MKHRCYLCQHWVEDDVIGAGAAERELAKHVAAEHRSRPILVPADVLRPCVCRGRGTCVACVASVEYARPAAPALSLGLSMVLSDRPSITFEGADWIEVREAVRAWLAEEDGKS